MKLKDYINYRGRSKKSKTSEYNLRTQHFYDGKPMKIKGEVYTGIRANFMNNLHIPTPYLIAMAQRKEFEKIYINSTPKQQEMLNKMSQSINSSHIKIVNARLDKEVLSLIEEFERSVDSLLKDSKKLKKVLQEAPQNNNFNLENSIENSFYKFYDVVSKIKETQIGKEELDKYLQELDGNITSVINSAQSIPHFLIDSSKFFNKTNDKNASFIERLGYLSKQIKGVTLLEHQGLDFFRELPIPDDYEVVNTGQLVVSGKQAGQDGLIIEKGLKIKATNGKEFSLSDLLNRNQEILKKISISDNEWERVTSSVLGIQSKYHRGGYIKMGQVKLEDIIQLDMKQAQALRMLYILHQGQEGYQGENVTHKFNVVKKHQDYKILFSYCLSRFINKLINKNYYMITKQGITDSYSYYMKLFRNSHYFAPIGAVSIYPIEQEYKVAINENT